VDVAYPPLFQSGGDYDLKLSAGSNDKPMHYGVIVCQAGARCEVFNLLSDYNNIA